MVIPEVRQERLYQKIANLIIKLINDNIFPPGTFLPPERELAKQLGVSRASLREALIVLEISGWIVIQSGNGVIVSDKKHLASDYTIEEILSIYFFEDTPAQFALDCDKIRWGRQVIGFLFYCLTFLTFFNTFTGLLRNKMEG